MFVDAAIRDDRKKKAAAIMDDRIESFHGDARRRS